MTGRTRRQYHDITIAARTLVPFALHQILVSQGFFFSYLVLMLPPRIFFNTTHPTLDLHPGESSTLVVTTLFFFSLYPHHCTLLFHLSPGFLVLFFIRGSNLSFIFLFLYPTEIQIRCVYNCRRTIVLTHLSKKKFPSTYPVTYNSFFLSLPFFFFQNSPPPRPPLIYFLS
jgi:hypothetical protein